MLSPAAEPREVSADPFERDCRPATPRQSESAPVNP